MSCCKQVKGMHWDFGLIFGEIFTKFASTGWLNGKKALFL